ncbi:hypothetical protein T1E_5433 [Pseudomonas putida DOT-T1E]|uniref:Uncharacterized protein n=1 Tax=Pseudomonas putida (strain DOT-T1E) TaxID=1196325 RepID=I7CH97_PSEPT|nr:hypothetical protein T1E_5433 [Pseudomonas putida DOT-T1E]
MGISSRLSQRQKCTKKALSIAYGPLKRFRYEYQGFSYRA